MTAFSEAFRAEVLRMARKEIKVELGNLRKTVAMQRSEIAALKRDVKDLVSQVKGLHKAAARQPAPGDALAQDTEAPTRRGPRRPPKLPHLWPPQTPPPELIGDRR